MPIKEFTLQKSVCSARAYLELSQVVQTEDIFNSGKLLVKDIMQKLRH